MTTIGEHLGIRRVIVKAERKGAVPGCPKVNTWTSRKEARVELLRQWAAGDYYCRGTHWCHSHQGFHLTSKIRRSGKNYLYRD
jgi:hypothetical protein